MKNFIYSCCFTALIYLPNLLCAQAWTKISCGGEFSLGLKSDGSLWAWGFNGNGQCGIGGTSTAPLPTKVNAEYDWADISAGGAHSLALKKNGTLWAWGDGQQGQTGLGLTNQVNDTPSQVGTDSDWIYISAGYASSYAIKKSGKLYCWGYNMFGELGDSTTNNATVPILVHGSISFKQVAAGGISVAAIAADGTLWTWGYGGDEQLGNGNIANVLVPQQISKDTNWAYITSGFEFSVALKRNGTIWSWGYNGNGQCGQNTTSNISVPEQIGTDSNWKFIASGSVFAFGINKDSSLYGWGGSIYGCLGINSTANQLVPMKVDGSNDWIFISAATGITDGQSVLGLHSIGLKKGYVGYCGTGADYVSQLGNDSTNNVDAFECEMGVITGIKQLSQLDPDVKIFPNPTSGSLSIQFSNIEQKTVQISLINIAGKLIFSKTDAVEELMDFDLSKYPKGIYLLQIVSDSSINNQKIVLN